MSAKEMFKELGYEYSAFHEFIRYSQKHYISDTDIIEFDTLEELVDCFRISDSPFSPAQTLKLDVKELQAINKQCEELGWLDVKNS